EPEQDALAAGAVDLAPLERVPDAVAIAGRRVDRDQATGHEERRLALEVEHLKGLRSLRRPAGIVGAGIALRDGRTAAEKAQPPGLVARARRLRHVAARELLVAGARTRGVVVARGDEAEAEAPGVRGIVEVRDRERVLRRALRPVVERRQEAVA